jgi:hypothetical protein
MLLSRFGVNMVAGPSRRLESFVGSLIPPPCREEVLGDLCERYVSPGQYLIEGLRVALFVTLSRVRRTTDPQLLLMEGALLYVSFFSAAWYMDKTFLDSQWGLLRLAVPGAITLVVVMLSDAWAVTKVRGVVVGITVAFLCQIGSLPTGIDLLGAGVGLLLVSAVRVLFLPGSDVPQRAGGPPISILDATAPGTMRNVGVTVLLLGIIGISLRYGRAGLMTAVVLAVMLYQINKSR